MTSPTKVAATATVLRQLARAKRSSKFRGIDIVLFDEAHRACFVIAGITQPCWACGMKFKRGEVAFRGQVQGPPVVHTRCVVAMAAVVNGGYASVDEAELDLERQRIEETGMFYG